MDDFQTLLNKQWPPIRATTLQLELDRVETHYGLHHTTEDILKGIGQ